MHLLRGAASVGGLWSTGPVLTFHIGSSLLSKECAVARAVGMPKVGQSFAFD